MGRFYWRAAVLMIEEGFVETTSNGNIEFLSDTVQNCFSELFNEAYKKDKDFVASVSEISMYLILKRFSSNR